jgi:hypothetical protein
MPKPWVLALQALAVPLLAQDVDGRAWTPPANRW